MSVKEDCISREKTGTPKNYWDATPPMNARLAQSNLVSYLELARNHIWGPFVERTSYLTERFEGDVGIML